MFDKRLMALCPESNRYIAGNIVFQWLEMMMNAVMIMAVARGVERFRHGEGSSAVLVGIMLIIAVTVAVRFFTSQASVRMSHMASRTVKQKLRELTVFFFSQSSRRLHDWFVYTKLYKDHLESFVEK